MRGLGKVLLFCCATCAATADPCWPCWEKACRMVESGGNPMAVGDQGRSIGAHQMSRESWLDAQRIDPTIGDYRNATNAIISAKACIAFAKLQARRFHQATGREPSPEEIYACYNAGFERMRQLKFDVRRSRQVQRHARRFAEIYARTHHESHHSEQGRRAD